MTAYVPSEPVQERLEDPEVPSVTLVELRLHVSPTEGDTEGVRVTVPVNELIDDRDIVELPATPALMDTPVGLADREKSGTATV